MLVKLSKFSSSRHFGVELELGNALTLGQLRSLVEKADSSRVVKVSEHYAQDYNNSYWHVKLDHSCGDVNGGYGCEVTSFKAKGVKDIRVIGKMVEEVRDGGANVNEKCGLHVHIEVLDYTWEMMAAFVANWIKMEPYLCHMVPPRRSANKYCRFHRNETWVKQSVQTSVSNLDLWKNVCPVNFDNKERRMALNLVNFVSYGRKTVEFRFPDATLEPLDVKNWIRFFVHIVDVGATASFPENLGIFDFNGFLANCGLSDNSKFVILSHGLRETKLWLIRRVIKYARSAEVKSKATQQLRNMVLDNE